MSYSGGENNDYLNYVSCYDCYNCKYKTPYDRYCVNACMRCNGLLPSRLYNYTTPDYKYFNFPRYNLYYTPSNNTYPYYYGSYYSPNILYK